MARAHIGQLVDGPYTIWTVHTGRPTTKRRLPR
jgi:hypothetical protein